MHLRSPKSIKIRCKAWKFVQLSPFTLPESWGHLGTHPSGPFWTMTNPDPYAACYGRGFQPCKWCAKKCKRRRLGSGVTWEIYVDLEVDPYMSWRVSTIQAGAEIVLENPKRLYDICLWFSGGWKMNMKHPTTQALKSSNLHKLFCEYVGAWCTDIHFVSQCEILV